MNEDAKLRTIGRRQHLARMIREYRNEDLDSIADLVEYFNAESECFKMVGGFSRSHFLDMLGLLSPFLRIWVRESTQEIVSALAMVEQDNLYSGEKGLDELFWFSVPESRGSLENVKLLKAAKNYAKNSGIAYLTMGAMEGFYFSKIGSFYKRMGFHLHQNQYICDLRNSDG